MRRFLNTLASLSALACLATLITWRLCSARAPDAAPIHGRLQIEPTGHGLRLVHASLDRRKSFTWFIGGNLLEPDGTHRKITPEGNLHSFRDGSARTIPEAAKTYAGFRWEGGAAAGPGARVDGDFKLWLTPWRALTIPYAAIAALTSIPPLLWLVLILRSRQRRARGLCPRCGYDLRATPERCPECGAGPAKAPV
jgi:hypothetical protein